MERGASRKAVGPSSTDRRLGRPVLVPHRRSRGPACGATVAGRRRPGPAQGPRPCSVGRPVAVILIGRRTWLPLAAAGNRMRVVGSSSALAKLGVGRGSPLAGVPGSGGQPASPGGGRAPHLGLALGGVGAADGSCAGLSDIAVVVTASAIRRPRGRPLGGSSARLPPLATQRPRPPPRRCRSGAPRRRRTARTVPHPPTSRWRRGRVGGFPALAVALTDPLPARPRCFRRLRPVACAIRGVADPGRRLPPGGRARPACASCRSRMGLSWWPSDSSGSLASSSALRATASSVAVSPRFIRRTPLVCRPALRTSRAEVRITPPGRGDRVQLVVDVRR